MHRLPSITTVSLWALAAIALSGCDNIGDDYCVTPPAVDGFRPFCNDAVPPQLDINLQLSTVQQFGEEHRNDLYRFEVPEPYVNPGTRRLNIVTEPRFTYRLRNPFKPPTDPVTLVGSGFNDCGDTETATVSVSYITDRALVDERAIAPSAAARTFPALVTYQDQVFSFFGSDGSGANAARYDILTDTWTILPDLPCTNEFSSNGAVIGSTAYTVAPSDDHLYAIDLESLTCSTVSIPGLDANLLSSYPAILPYNGELYLAPVIIGGNSHWVRFDPATGDWSSEQIAFGTSFHRFDYLSSDGRGWRVFLSNGIELRLDLDDDSFTALAPVYVGYGSAFYAYETPSGLYVGSPGQTRYYPSGGGSFEVVTLATRAFQNPNLTDQTDCVEERVGASVGYDFHKSFRYDGIQMVYTASTDQGRAQVMAVLLE